VLLTPSLTVIRLRRKGQESWSRSDLANRLGADVVLLRILWAQAGTRPRSSRRWLAERAGCQDAMVASSSSSQTATVDNKGIRRPGRPCL